MKTKIAFTSLLVALTMFAAGARALTESASHPAYLHALSNLRHALALIEAREAHSGSAALKADEQEAVRDIDAAIKEIKTAAVDDGKSLKDHPPVDPKGNHKDNLVRAHGLLRESYEECNKAEGNASVRALRIKIVHHIGDAVHAMDRAIKAAGG
jgi:hypothetical protein